MIILNSHRRFLAVLFCSFAAPTLAQQLTISGIVRDLNTHRKIQSVNIYVKGTELGTSSDFGGRYELRIPGAHREMVVIFQHIAYESREISLDSVKAQPVVDLQPRVIPMQGVEIEEELQRLEVHRDLPQTVSVIEAKNFDIRGYVDAGDLLRTDHSVQVDEDLSGKKTASIRGGNADEVVVLFNGVKMNRALDNVFDLSLLDLEDVQRFEIIKGSNTALYGPEAFSGVINIVPKLEQDYNLRFQQRFGTYRSGNWGLHLFQRLKRLQGSYSYKRGGTERNFVGSEDDRGLENSSAHHTANLSCSFSESSHGRPKNTLSAMLIHTQLEYVNRRDSEDLDNLNQLLSLKYLGDLAFVKELELTVSHRRLDEGQFLSLANSNGVFATLNRDIDDQALHVDAEKRFTTGRLGLLVAYQYQRNTLDFTDERRNIQEQPLGLQSAELVRNHHGFVAIAKVCGKDEADFLGRIDVDMSVRHDRLQDQQQNAVLRSGPLLIPGTPGLFGENDWSDTMYKFAIELPGYRDKLSFESFLNFGANVKFPTLFQQISSPLAVTGDAYQPNLNPEKSRSVELGFILTREVSNSSRINGWQLSGNFFQNHYDNKFREFATPGIPVTFYDNVQNARISGFESKSSVFLYRKKVTAELGLSRYFISEQAAFPFKSDFKRTVNLIVDHAGYSFQVHWFKEGEQTALLRFPDGGFALLSLEPFSNVDLHLSKTFEIRRLKLFANASARNVLNDSEVILSGLAIRDRRFYVTVGAQY